MKAYPAYKESGYNWLGKIPVHWKILPLRRGIEFLTDFEANGSFEDIRDNVVVDSDDRFAWYVRATDLQNRRLGFEEGNRTCNKETYEFLSKTKLVGGELLITKRGEIGKVYLMPNTQTPATLAPNLYLVRLNEKLFPRFAYLWFKSSFGNPQLVLADKSTTIGALYKNDIRDCLCIFPTLHEQQAIADFLDCKTAQIDVLIDKKQRQIDLLQEQRTALINHAVTKGLNPEVKMKDSGVEWLGEIPSHWEVKKGRYLFDIVSGFAPSQMTIDENGSYDYIKVDDLNTNDKTLYIHNGKEKFEGSQGFHYEEGIVLQRKVEGKKHHKLR